ncbi:MAG: hypothetical protein H7833_06250 [Magnetococcus sp. DMHC-1]
MKPFIKIRHPQVGELLARFEPSDEAAAVVDPKAPPHEALRVLLSGGCLVDAVHFMAHGLPKREAVWWACLCVRHAMSACLAVNEVALLDTVESWVLNPRDEARRKAMTDAEPIGFSHPATWCAVGAFWSGGSLSSPGQPEVPPAESLTGKAVSAAVILSAVRIDPAGASERFRLFLTWGVDIANGGQGRPS